MGFNKLNLGFVIHFNTPQSPIDYYQQVGRAGRALDKAYGICFLGAEDETINKYFIEKAFPKREAFQSVINCLEKADRPIKESEMQFKCNISAQGLKKLLKIMGSLDGSPIIKEDNKWVRTTNSFDIDWEEVQEIEDKRKNEWNNMKVYITSKSCLMQFLAKNLSDSDAEVCGKCSNCNPLSTFKLKNKGLISKATKFLKRENISI